MDPRCERAFILAQDSGFKAVLGAKLLFNLSGLIFLLIVYFRVVKSQKFQALHTNVRLALHLHVYYIIHVIVFMVAANSIDLYRVSIKRQNPCHYLLPFWLTYIVREGYMFGVLGQTLTFVFLSVERIVATFSHRYEHRTSKTYFLLATLLNVVFCFGYAYVYMGYDADWGARTEYFTQVNDRNGWRLASFVFCIIACECLSILLYNITYLLNNRGKNKVSIQVRRIAHISKSLTEKYQIDENRKVVGLLLPVCWIHFGIYMFTYTSYFFLIQPMYPNEPVRYASLIEAIGVVTFYAHIFALRLLTYFSTKRTTTSPVVTNEQTDKYFNQINALFRSSPART